MWHCFVNNTLYKEQGKNETTPYAIYIDIKKAGAPHEGFGDISIVFPRSTIDPQVDRQNRLYSNDAWTPTEPRTEYEVVDTWKLRRQMEEELGTDAFRATQKKNARAFHQAP